VICLSAAFLRFKLEGARYSVYVRLSVRYRQAEGAIMLTSTVTFKHLIRSSVVRSLSVPRIWWKSTHHFSR